jgi:hypothetical protein
MDFREKFEIREGVRLVDAPPLFAHAQEAEFSCAHPLNVKSKKQCLGVLRRKESSKKRCLGVLRRKIHSKKRCLGVLLTTKQQQEKVFKRFAQKGRQQETMFRRLAF